MIGHSPALAIRAHAEMIMFTENIIDNRVHCCFYFISPYGHGLKPLDIDFMKQLSNKVNIVPVIAKSDCLTMTEIKKLKARIIEELGAAGIRIYQLPDVDTDEDEEYKLQVRPTFFYWQVLKHYRLF